MVMLPHRCIIKVVMMRVTTKVMDMGTRMEPKLAVRVMESR